MLKLFFNRKFSLPFLSCVIAGAVFAAFPLLFGVDTLLEVLFDERLIPRIRCRLNYKPDEWDFFRDFLFHYYDSHICFLYLSLCLCILGISIPPLIFLQNPRWLKGLALAACVSMLLIVYLLSIDRNSGNASYIVPSVYLLHSLLLILSSILGVYQLKKHATLYATLTPIAVLLSLCVLCIRLLYSYY